MIALDALFSAPSAPVEEDVFGPCCPTSSDPEWQWNKRQEMWKLEMLYRAVSNEETNPLRKPFKEAIMDIDERAWEGRKQYENAIADYRELAAKYLASRPLEGDDLHAAIMRVFPGTEVVEAAPAVASKPSIRMEAFA